MSAEKEVVFDDSSVSIHYIICECGKTFPTENGLREHLEKEHPQKRERKEYKCGVCGWIYAREKDCIAHYEEAHMEVEQEYEEEQQEQVEAKPELDEQEVMLEEQFEVELQEEEIKQDIEVAQEEYVESDEQHYLISVPDTLGDTYYVHTEVVDTQEHETEDISHEISQEETTRATQVLVKAEPETDEPEVPVPSVPSVPTKPKHPRLKMVRDPDTGTLVLVYTRSAPKRPHKQKESSTPAKKNIVCETCGKKYSSAAALKYHQRVHTGDRPYQCHLCPKAFTMPLFLEIHVRTHTGERPYQCPECPKAFSNRAALLRHGRVHTGEKPYVCPMCLKSFTQSNSMKLHVATVHLKQPAPYKSQNRRAKAEAKAPKSYFKGGPEGKLGINQGKIKAFASQANRSRTRESEVEITELTQDEMNCLEVVCEEEIH